MLFRWAKSTKQLKKVYRRTADLLKEETVCCADVASRGLFAQWHAGVGGGVIVERLTATHLLCVEE
jgi:hypothetical protein